jgi:uncharacterized protein
VIELAKLPAEGLRLEGGAERVQVDRDDALRDLSWRLFAQPFGRDVYFDIQGAAVYEGVCCRCLEPVDRRAKLRTQFLGSADPELVARGSHLIGKQDLDVVYLPEEMLDEEALVREQFILQRPMQLLCKEGCLGLCPRCGKNWNKGQCQCSPEYSSAPGAFAKALAGLKLDLGP